MRIGTSWLSRRTDHSDTPGEFRVEVVVDRGSGVDKAVDAARPGPGRRGGCRLLTIALSKPLLLCAESGS